ncbi:hypothetical protein [Limimaricola sp. G21655-S1]|uniref:hypothetical protein n=1 Tax=Limimaricola sp. G21655-S1 TaxID=3014768 RepID=UPI0027B99D12|nr:hypothetical protein [Limimaricola sp. G21655-S1]
MAPITAGGICMEAGAARRLVTDGFKVGVLSSLGKAEALGKELGGIGVMGSNRSVEGLGRFVEGAAESWSRIDGGLSRGV